MKSLDAVATNSQIELALLNSWLDAADVGLVVLDDTACAVMINQAAARMLGVQAIEQINQPLARVLAEVQQKQDVLFWALKARAETSKQVVIEPPANELGKRSKVNCLIKLSIHEAAGKFYKILALSDVTELIASHDELAALRRQWQALNAGVVISDATQPDMPIVFVNNVFEQVTGYSAEETLGRNCRFLQRDDKDQPGLLEIRKAILAKSNGYATLRNYRKDGSLFHNELFISPVRNEAGIVTHFVGIQHVRDERYLNDIKLSQTANSAVH